MYTLRSLNVYRIVADERGRDDLLRQGFELVEEPIVEIATEPVEEPAKKSKGKSVK